MRDNKEKEKKMTHIIDIATVDPVIVSFDKKTNNFSAEDSTLIANGYESYNEFGINNFFTLKNSKTGMSVNFHYTKYHQENDDNGWWIYKPSDPYYAYLEFIVFND